MSSEHTTDIHHAEEHGDTMTKGKIRNVFFILCGITAIEFFIALGIVPHHEEWRHYVNFAYIVLTLFKAFYIVAYFMHLKFEKVTLIYSIVVPILFIIGLILVLTNESHHWIDLRA